MHGDSPTSLYYTAGCTGRQSFDLGGSPRMDMFTYGAGLVRGVGNQVLIERVWWAWPKLACITFPVLWCLPNTVSCAQRWALICIFRVLTKKGNQALPMLSHSVRNYLVEKSLFLDKRSRRTRPTVCLHNLHVINSALCV